MAVPVAPNNTAPLSNAGKGVGHQLAKAASLGTYAPSTYTPVPVASALKGGITGVAYSETITAQGGTSPYTFTVTSGAVPGGCSMSSAGIITGTPTATGTASFTVRVTDANGYTGSQAFTILVSAPSSGGGSAYVFVT